MLPLLPLVFLSCAKRLEDLPRLGVLRVGRRTSSENQDMQPQRRLLKLVEIRAVHDYERHPKLHGCCEFAFVAWVFVIKRGDLVLKLLGDVSENG